MVEQRDLDIIMNNQIDWECFRDARVLVTAATGRLGMYFVEALLKADIDLNLNMNVIALARNEEKLKKVFGASLKLPNLHVLIQDITEPIAVSERIDYIIHTAGAASPQDFSSHPVETLWGHVQGTRNVLELAKKNPGAKVFYVSTVEIYGEPVIERPIGEDDFGVLRCDHSRACYPEAKRLCEAMLASYEAEYGVRYAGARLCHTLGPGIALDDGRAFAEFLQCVLEGRDIVLHTAGDAARTYTYVADAVGAMLLALTKGNEHYYNIANVNNLITIRDLAELIAGLDPRKKVQVRFDNADAKLKYLPFTLGIMDVSRIMDLGWYPQAGIKDTFRYTLDSFLQQRNR